MESRSVNASSNFWGRIGDVEDIGARIYDKFDNKSLIEVNFYPPYLDSSRLRQGLLKFKSLSFHSLFFSLQVNVIQVGLLMILYVISTLVLQQPIVSLKICVLVLMHE